MYDGRYVFTQITMYLPQRQFRRIVYKFNDRTQNWRFSHWKYLLVLIFGQLLGCSTLRELTDITSAHAKRSNQLGFFRWALFRSTKSGIKVHTQIDIITEIPIFYRITNDKVHDSKAMDWIEYESNACYIFDRGYFDLARLFRIHLCGAFFVIREKGKPEFEILDGEGMLNGENGVLLDQTIRFTGKRNAGNYPAVLRRIVYYAADLGRSFVYYTNNFYLAAKDIALLYRYRWQVELFFKWIKQHLRVKRFWGDSENGVRVQILVAILTYCLVAIIEHDLELDRPVFEVMHILGSSLLVKDDLLKLFNRRQDDMGDSGQFELNFNC